MAEAGAGGLGQGQGEHARLAQRGPVVGADRRASSPSRARRCSSGSRPATMARMPSASSRWSSLDAEVHQRCALGSPRMRSATMLRCTCEVPAAMVDEIDLNQAASCSALPSGEPSRPRQRVGAQRGPVEDLHGQVAQGLGVLGERELEDRAADARDAGLRRLGDVALGERPQRVERRHQVADAPGQAGVVRADAEPRRDAGAARRSSRMHSSSSPTKAVPRSKDRVTIVTRQPSFSSPTRLATGTRTSLRNSSANSVRARDGAQRADLDAGRVHGHDEPGDAAVALLARADQQLAEVGHLGVGRPDLRAGDDVVVAVAHRPGAQGGQVAAGVGLAEALAPHLLAAQDRREVALLLGARSPRR